jgi:hypothetical protein
VAIGYDLENGHDRDPGPDFDRGNSLAGPR